MTDGGSAPDAGIDDAGNDAGCPALAGLPAGKFILTESKTTVDRCDTGTLQCSTESEFSGPGQVNLSPLGATYAGGFSVPGAGHSSYSWDPPTRTGPSELVLHDLFAVDACSGLGNPYTGDVYITVNTTNGDVTVSANATCNGFQTYYMTVTVTASGKLVCNPGG
jgi:hypothetical protein